MSEADSLSGQPVLIPSLADDEVCSESLDFKQGHYRCHSGATRRAVSSVGFLTYVCVSFSEQLAKAV